MSLEKLREQIDAIDDQIVKLYAERMEVSKQVGTLKGETGVVTTNSLREKQIINRVTAQVDDDIKLYTKQVFGTLFETSKAYQLKFVGSKNKLNQTILKAVENIKSFPTQAIVACQGVEGAYSNIATEQIFPISNIMYFKDFEGVFNAVEKGLCQYGVLPIENSSVGSVNAVYDLMKKHNFYIVRSVKLRVRHCLLARDGVELNDIKDIFSHEQAIRQCGEFLKQFKNIKITIVDNTAMAAEMLATSGRTDAACIASRECAGIYNLHILQPHIQDNDFNYTRFIAISKNLEIFDGANKISIMANLPHEAGSLNKILNKFSTLGLNLTKLESRPMANSAFEFLFYFDFDADICDTTVQNLVGELDDVCDRLVFLGSYKELA